MFSLSSNIQRITADCDTANRHISSELLKLENIVENKGKEHDINLLELLEHIENIQVQHNNMVENIKSEEKIDYNKMKDDLKIQLDIFKRSTELLEIAVNKLRGNFN